MNFKEWRARILKSYGLRNLLRDELQGVNVFPCQMTLRKISGRELSDHFSEYRKSIEQLSRECQEFGVNIVFANFQHRSLGVQALPEALVFDSRESYLKFVDKEREFAVFAQAHRAVLDDLPALTPFFVRHPLKLLDHPGEWPRILQVCRFLNQSRSSGLYLRQLEIPEVDTKFIEGRKKIITQLMDFLTSLEKVEDVKSFAVTDATSLAVRHFEKRHGLIKEPPRLRFRVLDLDLATYFRGLDDIEATLPALRNSEVPCETVFIVENKVTGLCIPRQVKSVVFFELGYKVSLLEELPWLHRRRLFYWGDLDTHGFAMLSQLRQHFPHLRSLLMDETTLVGHRSLWTKEDRPFLGDCPYLTPAESEVFRGLQSNVWGPQVRLEQERVRLAEFTAALANK